MRYDAETYEHLVVDVKKVQPGMEEATLELYDDEKKVEDIDLPYDIEFAQIEAILKEKGFQKKEEESVGVTAEKRRRMPEARDRRERSSSSCGSDL